MYLCIIFTVIEVIIVIEMVMIIQIVKIIVIYPTSFYIYYLNFLAYKMVRVIFKVNITIIFIPIT